MDNLVSFVQLAQATYDGLSGSRDQETLYFTSDTHRIYKGDAEYTDSVVLVAAIPEVADAVANKLYINSSTFEAKITSDNTSWVTLSPGYLTDGANWADADSGKLATIGLIKKGMVNFLSSMGAGEANKIVTSTSEGGVQRSGAVIGGESLTGAANTVATEAAVVSAISWKSI